MLLAAARRTVRVMGVAAARSKTAALRPQQALAGGMLQKATFFSRLWKANTQTGIPDRNDTGAHKLELDSIEFNREPIHPPQGSGTKENPIEVPSEFKERVVGFEHPDSHAIYWFTVKAGDLYYVNPIGMYFKLVPLPEFDDAMTQEAS